MLLRQFSVVFLAAESAGNRAALVLWGKRKNLQCLCEPFKLLDVEIRPAMPRKAVSFGPRDQFTGAISVI